ncbi:hypothetical protein TNIN_218501 [Trichonephila inaurata madagascariensis]|uniref:Uncharacterized protein n=1 Tax=Trichonephila inaurata madagascariensis TaxID=2747483 RepID=A0A8X6WXT3_9ARAC|nr:hypothetical protein TNIN_22461 [Trichonephila inaurata madagascariensis]GFY78081.1 hypothetical protein TNIN_218501 [Trichonephila inaurata madagascariensis]
MGRRLANRSRRVRPSFNGDHARALRSVMKGLSVKSSMGSSHAREAERRMGIPELSYLHGLLNLYPYKIREVHQFSLGNTDSRQNFAIWVLGIN